MTDRLGLCIIARKGNKNYALSYLSQHYNITALQHHNIKNMKRLSWLLLIAFVVLGGISYCYFSNKEAPSTGDDFAVQDINQIHRIVLADKQGNSTLLKRIGDTWTCNEQYRARPEAVNLLLETLQKLRVQSPVPQAADQNIIAEISSVGIRVEVYDRRNRPLKVLYVGGISGNRTGTYMMLEGAKYPYIVHIPSWEGSVRPRFMTELEDWRDRTIFGYSPENIQQVKVDYPNQPESSFVLTKQDSRNYLIKRPDEEDAAALLANEGRALYYLKGYQRIIAEAFETDHPQRDSIFQLTPFCTMQITGKDGNTKVVDLYPLPGRQIETDIDGNPIRAKTDRYLAYIDNNQELMLVQHRVFKELLAPYSYFIEGETLEKVPS